MRNIHVVAAFFAIVLVPPAQAWEHDYQESHGGLTHWVSGFDLSGKARLTFFCSSLTPGDMFLELVAVDAPAAAGSPALLSVVVGGKTFGPLLTEVISMSSPLKLGTDVQATTGQAALAVYASNSVFEVSYGQGRWAFDGADYSEAFGAVLDGCA